MRRLVLVMAAAIFGAQQAGNAEEQVFKLPKGELTIPEFRFSPDGRWIMYRAMKVEDRNVAGRIVVLDVDSRREIARVTTDHEYSSGPCAWSRDGLWAATVGIGQRSILWKVNPRPTPKAPLLSMFRQYTHYHDTLPQSLLTWHDHPLMAFSPTANEFFSVCGVGVGVKAPDREQSLKIWRYNDTDSLKQPSNLFRSPSLWKSPEGACQKAPCHSSNSLLMEGNC
jgi:hypothetical protein